MNFKATYFERDCVGTIIYYQGGLPMMRIANVSLEQFKRIVQRLGGTYPVNDYRATGYFVR